MTNLSKRAMQLSDIQILNIYSKQADLNITMGGENWTQLSEKENPFMVATIVELIESVQHLNYKWWVHAEDDMPQAQMEVIDMLHFVASFGIRKLGIGSAAQHMIEAQNLHQQAYADTWLKATRVRPEFEDGVVEGRWKTFLQLNQSALSVIQNGTKGLTYAAGDFNITYVSLCYDLLALSYELGLPKQELYTRYIGKHALNSFRQEMGSKTRGVVMSREEYRASDLPKPYLKIWTDAEDNEFLHYFLKFNSEATEEEIQQFLRVEYEKHV